MISVLVSGSSVMADGRLFLVPLRVGAFLSASL